MRAELFARWRPKAALMERRPMALRPPQTAAEDLATLCEAQCAPRGRPIELSSETSAESDEATGPLHPSAWAASAAAKAPKVAEPKGRAAGRCGSRRHAPRSGRCTAPKARQLPETPRLDGDVQRLAVALRQPPQERSRPSTERGPISSRPVVSASLRPPRPAPSPGPESSGSGWYSPLPTASRFKDLRRDSSVRKASLPDVSKTMGFENVRQAWGAEREVRQAEGAPGMKETSRKLRRRNAQLETIAQRVANDGAKQMKNLGLTMQKKVHHELSPEEQMPDRVGKLAKQLRIPLDMMKQAYDTFLEICLRPDDPMAVKGVKTNKKGELLDEDLDVFKEGSVNLEGFSKVICKLIGCHSTAELPPGLIQQSFQDADAKAEKAVTFLDFAFWYSRHFFNETMLLTNAQMEVRELARKYELPIIEVEQYKKKFDFFDEDSSGYIDYAEFRTLLNALVKLPGNCELPPSRVQQFWAEADRERKEAVSFEGFLIFFYRYFNLSTPCACPFREYYRGIRRVPVAHV
ncbi:unnamed protein product [Effrenium voratum]|uniref:EF-hand domain-containing protein n=1 Tax=Effrenium voratum TaxID=2562239 RepID=A0AA36IAU6_9DINO|nr:unnamed protein product [Effrenium voratum]CAJ1420521.1 unnamed protein product [Effrenium voratum]